MEKCGTIKCIVQSSSSTMGEVEEQHQQVGLDGWMEIVRRRRTTGAATPAEDEIQVTLLMTPIILWEVLESRLAAAKDHRPKSDLHLIALHLRPTSS